jgi:hypothetical protein
VRTFDYKSETFARPDERTSEARGPLVRFVPPLGGTSEDGRADDEAESAQKAAAFRARVQSAVTGTDGYFSRQADKVRAELAAEEKRKAKRAARAHNPAAPREEWEEQAEVCDWLKARRVSYCHVPNGGKRSGPREGAFLKRIGVKSGVPDLLIFSAPLRGWQGEALIGHVPRGVAIEMKRTNGSRSDVSDNQAAWLKELAAHGWLVHVAYGASDAIAWLSGLGFGR